MEELFRVRIENVELAEIKTLGELLEFVAQKLFPEV
jgi:acyl carrier protein